MMCFPSFGILIGTLAVLKFSKVSRSTVVAALAMVVASSTSAMFIPEHSGEEARAGSAHWTHGPTLEPACLLTTDWASLHTRHWSEPGPSHEWQSEWQAAQRFSPATKYFPEGHLHWLFSRVNGPPWDTDLQVRQFIAPSSLQVSQLSSQFDAGAQVLGKVSEPGAEPSGHSRHWSAPGPMQLLHEASQAEVSQAVPAVLASPSGQKHPPASEGSMLWPVTVAQGWQVEQSCFPKEVQVPHTEWQ